MLTKKKKFNLRIWFFKNIFGVRFWGELITSFRKRERSAKRTTSGGVTPGELFNRELSVNESALARRGCEINEETRTSTAERVYSEESQTMDLIADCKTHYYYNVT